MIVDTQHIEEIFDRQASDVLLKAEVVALPSAAELEILREALRAC